MTTASDFLTAVLPSWRTLLQDWSSTGKLTAAAQEALLLDEEPQILRDLVAQWSAEEFGAFPPIARLYSPDLNNPIITRTPINNTIQSSALNSGTKTGAISEVYLNNYQDIALGDDRYAYGIKYNAGKDLNEYWKIDLSNGNEEILTEIRFDSGGWNGSSFDVNDFYISTLGSAGDFRLFSLQDGSKQSFYLNNYQDIALGDDRYAYGIKYNAGKDLNEYWKIDLSNGNEEILTEIRFDSGGWNGSSFDVNDFYISTLGSAGDFQTFSILPEDVSAPEISSISVQGRYVTISFLEEISADRISPNAFLVELISPALRETTIRPVSTVEVDPKDSTRLILTLTGRAPSSLLNLRVSYTAPDSDQTTGVVQDLAGNDLESFTNRFADTFISSSTAILADQYKNLTLTGNSRAIGTGNALDNTLMGNSANNTLFGFAGADNLHGEGGNDNLTGGDDADMLTGGLGSDTFRFALNDSPLSSFDRITDLEIGIDRIDGPRSVSAANVRELGEVSALTQEAIAAVLTPSNFVRNGAATFTLETGAETRTFLALNNGTAGFSTAPDFFTRSGDAVIEITGYTGLLTDLAVV